MRWHQVADGLELRQQVSAGTRSLLDSLVESGDAEFREERHFLTHLVIAHLADAEAQVLGLPDTLPFSFRMRGTGAVVRPGTNLRLDWFQRGKPVYLKERRGSLADFGDDGVYRIPSPIFELLEAWERYNNEGEGATVEDRLMQWAEVKAWLPDEDVLEDEHLRQITVHVASAFSVTPKLTATGDPDFDVVPGNWRSVAGPGEVSEERRFRGVLAEAHQEKFEDRFRRLQARSAYPVTRGTFVVPTPDVARALKEIRTIRDEGAGAIRAFVRQPQAVLKTRLEGQADELAERLDDVYSEADDYGDRVRGIGLWQPKVMPWIKKASEPWLPPESFGVMIGDQPIEIEPEDVPELVAVVEKAMEEGLPSVPYRNQELPATKDVLDILRSLPGLARPDGAPKEERDATALRPRGRTVLQVDDNLDSAQYVRTRRVIERSEDISLSNRVHSTLYSHQAEALEWLKEAWQAGEPGVLLADDMGLGKTVQALVFMVWLKGLMETGQLPERPILVVAPTGLLKNWVEEHEIHLSGHGLGRVVEVYGSGLRAVRTGGRDTDTGEIGLDLREISSAGWVLTSYETYRDYQLSFGRVQWSLAVFDEVQKVKNPAAAMTDAAKSANAEFVLSLTGTPVENRLADLWSIMDLTQPGLLGALKEFSKEWESEGVDLTGLRRILTDGEPPAMLRRLKEDHLEGLPSRRYVFGRAEMPEIQASAYDSAIAQARQGGPGGTLEALGLIRSVSLHPHARGSESLQEYVARSARLRLTLEWLYEIQAKGEKVLVFAESRAIQAVLAEIATELLGLPHRPLLINGQVSGPKRQERVNEFQSRGNGFDMMVLSPKAGGVGITLTAANHVIHLSRWWNPAVEDQCTDRVYRIGQKKEVLVYHPLAEHPRYGLHSFDVRLDDLLREKRQLSRAVLAPAGASSEDFERLLRDVTWDESEGRTQVDLAMVDTLTGIQFESWVGDQLRLSGYRVDHTPWSGDGGIDLIAEVPGRPTLLVQCKHTQANATLSRHAVEEVLRGVQRYSGYREPIPLVVTNSAQVGKDTSAFGFGCGVQVWTRHALSGLSDARVYLGPIHRAG